MTKRVSVSKTTLFRVFEAAIAQGAKSISVRPDGTIVIDLQTAAVPTDEDKQWAHDV